MTDLTHHAVQRWLDGYLAAWRANDRDRIEALFTEDAAYRYAPWGPAVVGAAEIAADWLRDPDDPGSWDAEYAPLTIAGDTAIATGETSYVDGRTYANLFVIRFDGDRCASFTEWYMEHPPDYAAD